jgi:hypothetical protein
LSRERNNVAEAEAVTNVEGNMCGPAMRGADALPWSENTSRRKGTRRNLGYLGWPVAAPATTGCDRKSRRRSCRSTGEESDGSIVPTKCWNKPVRSGGGQHGGKGPSRRESGRRSTVRTQCRTSRACASKACGSELHGLPGPERRSRLTAGRSPVRESRTPGSVRGAVSNHRPYRDLFFKKERPSF